VGILEGVSSWLLAAARTVVYALLGRLAAEISGEHMFVTRSQEIVTARSYHSVKRL